MLPAGCAALLLLFITLTATLTACSAAESGRRPAAPPPPNAAEPRTTFWNCLHAASQRPRGWLKSAMQQAQEAADYCAQLLPPDRNAHPPEDGTAVRQCLDRERYQWQRYARATNQPAEPDELTFQGLAKLCNIGADWKGYSPEFLEPANPAQPETHNMEQKTR